MTNLVSAYRPLTWKSHLVRQDKISAFILRDSLQKVVINIPRQNDLSQYEKILYQQVPENTIVRWYASKITETMAELEVIVESKGIGNSGSTSNMGINKSN